MAVMSCRRASLQSIHDIPAVKKPVNQGRLEIHAYPTRFREAAPRGTPSMAEDPQQQQAVQQQLPRPAALLFDLNGTLFPADSAATAFRKLGLPSSAVELWFTRVLRDGFAAQLAGTFLPFRHFATRHLGCLLAQHPNAAQVSAEEAAEQVLAAWSDADLWPDALPALRAMHAAGFTLAVLTNGSADGIARSVLQKAGVEGCFAALLDIGQAQAWKPAPQSYAFAVQRLGLAPEQVMMVASHPWDLHGALQAGLQAAYVQRDPAEPFGFPPDCKQPRLLVSNFGELAAALGAL